MGKFEGFPAGKVRFTRIPEPFFHDLLPFIDDLHELKVTLYVLWRLEQMEGDFRYLNLEAIKQDATFMTGMQDVAQLSDGLQRAVTRGTLIASHVVVEGEERTIYFLNSARGQAAVQAIEQGDWQPNKDALRPIELGRYKANIFRLYEEHIGPLTPMLAETLADAEKSYPAAWVEDAVRIAVENNVRRWRYIEAILKSWQREGRDERTNRRHTQKDRRRYIEGEFSEFIES